MVFSICWGYGSIRKDGEIGSYIRNSCEESIRYIVFNIFMIFEVINNYLMGLEVLVKLFLKFKSDK